MTLACVPLSWFFHSFPPRDYMQKKKHPVFTECFSNCLIQWATSWPTRTPDPQNRLWRGSYDSGMAVRQRIEHGGILLPGRMGPIDDSLVFFRIGKGLCHLFIDIVPAELVYQLKRRVEPAFQRNVDLQRTVKFQPAALRPDVEGIDPVKSKKGLGKAFGGIVLILHGNVRYLFLSQPQLPARKAQPPIANIFPKGDPCYDMKNALKMSV